MTDREGRAEGLSFEEWWAGTFEASCVEQFGWTLEGVRTHDLLRQCWHARDAELERLREALERIATSAWVYDPAAAAVRMITIAEAALAGEPEREHA